MTYFLFPDNTVLINFALIARMDLLNRLVNGRGQWVQSIATECARSAQIPGLDALADAWDIFGEPPLPDGAENQNIQVLRIELARPGDPFDKNLGEAETLAIMINRNMYSSLFVTDDGGAAELAKARSLRVLSTCDLLKMAFKVNFIDTDTAWGYIQVLRQNKRALPRLVATRSSFEQWLTPQASLRP